MYGIPLKWEPHGEVTTWGEATLILLHRKNIYLHDFALHKKGVVYEVHAWKQGVLDGQWEQWVDAHSPIARTVLKSLLPSILSKSLLYALNRHDVFCNLRSLLWGLGVRAYPDQWWRPMVLRFFKRFKLNRVGIKRDETVVIRESNCEEIRTHGCRTTTTTMALLNTQGYRVSCTFSHRNRVVVFLSFADVFVHAGGRGPPPVEV